MNKRKFAIGALLLAAPLPLYNLVDFIQGYIPATEPYKKTPYQFEEAFNEQMGAYGMSINIDSVPFQHNDTVCDKTIPISCEDGSVISCTYFPTSESHKSLTMEIQFEQRLTGAADETIYITPCSNSSCRNSKRRCSPTGIKRSFLAMHPSMKRFKSARNFLRETPEKRKHVCCVPRLAFLAV